VEWTIKEGDAIAGGTIYHLSDRLDAGAIAAQDWVFVKKNETARELWERALAPLGSRLLAQVIDQAKTSGVLPSMPQDEQFATKAPRLDEKRPDKKAARRAEKRGVVTRVNFREDFTLRGSRRRAPRSAPDRWSVTPPAARLTMVCAIFALVAGVRFSNAICSTAMSRIFLKVAT
jgi:hypothetical protein